MLCRAEQMLRAAEYAMVTDVASGPEDSDVRSSRIEGTEAADTLDELRAIADRTHQAATASVTRTPLVIWGVAWLLGYAALDLLPWSIAIPLGSALSTIATLGTWLGQSRAVVNGWERRIQLSFVAFMACSPVLVLAIMPVPAHTILLFLGALWGVALLLYAVATGDRVLGVIGVLIVVAAAALHIIDPAHDLLMFGMVAGGAMASLGLRRMRVPR